MLIDFPTWARIYLQRGGISVTARTDFDRRLGEQIARVRAEAEMTQEELGRLVHLSRVAIGQIEAGKRKVTADELQRFSAALQIPADYLVDPANRAPRHRPRTPGPVSAFPSRTSVSSRKCSSTC
jgi:ribosome-binding protein aMBF1 (putative translation factor)